MKSSPTSHQHSYQPTTTKLTLLRPPSQPKQALENEESLTQEQMMQSLNFSIEDLLDKISKVTQDYRHIPLTHQTIHTMSLIQKDIDINSTKHIAQPDRKEQDNNKTSKSSNSSSDSSDLQIKIPASFSTKNIHMQSTSLFTSQKWLPAEIPTLGKTKINSLFECRSVREVAASQIFQTPIDSPLSNDLICLGQSEHFKDKQLMINDFQLGRCIGSGKFGDVHICKHKQTGGIFALKKIFKATVIEYGMVNQLVLELKIMYKIDHPHVVKLYAHFFDQYHIFLLMELAEGGMLMDRMPFVKGKQPQVSNILDQMIQAVDCLHSNNIVHRDIKPENIVILFDSTYKLCDFGWASLVLPNAMKTTFCGTLDYISPQMKDQGQYSAKVDLWSLGVLTFELLVGQAPFKQQLANWRRQGRTPDGRQKRWQWRILYPPQTSGLAESFMRCLLKEDPNERASLHFLRNHLFIRKYWCSQQNEEIRNAQRMIFAQ